jgi:hypothetical protein
MVSFSGRVSPLSLVASYPEQVSHAWVANERNVGTVIASEQDQHISAPTNHRKLPMYAMHRWAAPPPTASPTASLHLIVSRQSTEFIQARLHTIVRVSVDSQGLSVLGRIQPSPNRPDPYKRVKGWTEESLGSPTRSTLLSALLRFFTPQRRRS